MYGCIHPNGKNTGRQNRNRPTNYEINVYIFLLSLCQLHQSLKSEGPHTPEQWHLEQISTYTDVER